MSEQFAQAIGDTGAWFARARAAGWLTEGDAAGLAALEHGAPADLFDGTESRPLVVAFFGGTGVGKSSLLNRLAGAELARTGVERPTSHEVTLYVHESVGLDKLGEHLPLERVRIERHDQDARRSVLWIDTPDIDSTEPANRRQALAWLNHIDLVVYVVSPERYRDDAGWRVLRERGGRHGWMFVMNHWDAGCDEQAKDFRRLLRDAGFDAPIVLRTCCAVGTSSHENDEFAELEQSVSQLIDAHGLRELDRLGRRARLLDLRRTLMTAAQRLGDDDRWSELTEFADTQWRKARDTIAEGMEWTLNALAARFAAHPNSVTQRIVSQAALAVRAAANKEKPAADTPDDDASAAKSELQSVASEVWDAWADNKIAECLDAIEVAARRRNLPADPARQALENVASRASRLVTNEVETALRLGMARPGSVFRRVGRQLTGFCTALLPMLALLWIGDSVVRGYWRGATGQGEFLGMPFAVHSLLLVLVAWGVPFAFDRMLRPRLERTALRALRAGLSIGVERLGEELRTSLASVGEERRSLIVDAKAITSRIAAGALRRVDTTDKAVSRVIAAAGA